MPKRVEIGPKLQIYLGAGIRHHIILVERKITELQNLSLELRTLENQGNESDRIVPHKRMD